jgi:hypothetical protein
MSEIILPAYLTAQSSSETVGACCRLLAGVEDDVLIALCDQLKSRITEACQLQKKFSDVVVEQAVA